MFDTEAWLGRRAFDNWDLSKAFLGFMCRALLLGIVVVGLVGVVMNITGWPNQTQPVDRTDYCPVILANDKADILARKIHKCKHYYRKQY